MDAYLPAAGYEYATTHRYQAAKRRRWQMLHDDASSGAAGPSRPDAAPNTDLCVLATRSMKTHDVLTHCRAALKDLSRAEDETLQLRAAESRQSEGATRDFSVIRSSSRGCSQLLLGPARFINHDCNPNAEFRRTGHQLAIRIIRPVRRDEEITTYYGDNYFEWGNSECMCATCEVRGSGFFAPPESAQQHALSDANGKSVAESLHEDSRITRSSSRTGTEEVPVLGTAMTPLEQAYLAIDSDARGNE